jgi:hypothetical protein
LRASVERTAAENAPTRTDLGVADRSAHTTRSGARSRARTNHCGRTRLHLQLQCVTAGAGKRSPEATGLLVTVSGGCQGPVLVGDPGARDGENRARALGGAEVHSGTGDGREAARVGGQRVAGRDSWPARCYRPGGSRPSGGDGKRLAASAASA